MAPYFESEHPTECTQFEHPHAYPGAPTAVLSAAQIAHISAHQCAESRGITLREVADAQGNPCDPSLFDNSYPPTQPPNETNIESNL